MMNWIRSVQMTACIPPRYVYRIVTAPMTRIDSSKSQPVNCWRSRAVRNSRSPSATVRVTMNSPLAARCTAGPNRWRSSS